MDVLSAMSAQTFALNYNMALLKKTMEDVAEQAVDMVNDLAETVSMPSEFNFDVYG